ncbi:MAG: hypothetical protein WDO14_24535 [Bacteroidota bacterium]
MKTSFILMLFICGAVASSHAQTNIQGTIFSDSGGSVSFGTKTPASNYLLSVNGKVITGGTRIVKLSTWPDYVFENDYLLMPLPDLKKYINANHHLPGVPDAETIKASGTDVAETSEMILKKAEELTLYLLQLDERLKALEKRSK